MHLKAVGYYVFQSPNWDAWLSFLQDLVRADVDVQPDLEWARVRLDSRFQRILLERSAEPAFALGLEVADAGALDDLKAHLHRSGVPTQSGSASETARRCVQRFEWFLDPDGNRLEAHCGLAKRDDPPVFSKPIGGFRTGRLGVGHVVLSTPNFAVMGAFYRETLGFGMSDFCRSPFVADFMHLNPRHHSLALIQSNLTGIQHVMLEYLDWDDVGRAYDMALQTPDMIGQSLGRHSNDLMTSFYAYTPDRFMLEFGWAGRLIGDDWQVQKIDGPSLWGHERYWLPQKSRDDARAILKALADEGVRAPVVGPSEDEYGPELNP